MDKDTFWFMLPFIIICCVLTIPIIIIGLPDMFPTYKTTEGTVVDIQISAGGWMSPHLTTLIFNNGRVITFTQIHNEFQIGKTYKITYHWSGKGANKIDKIEEIKQ